MSIRCPTALSMTSRVLTKARVLFDGSGELEPIDFRRHQVENGQPERISIGRLRFEAIQALPNIRKPR